MLYSCTLKGLGTATKTAHQRQVDREQCRYFCRFHGIGGHRKAIGQRRRGRRVDPASRYRGRLRDGDVRFGNRMLLCRDRTGRHISRAGNQSQRTSKGRGRYQHLRSSGCEHLHDLSFGSSAPLSRPHRLAAPRAMRVGQFRSDGRRRGPNIPRFQYRQGTHRGTRRYCMGVHRAGHRHDAVRGLSLRRIPFLGKHRLLSRPDPSRPGFRPFR